MSITAQGSPASFQRLSHVTGHRNRCQPPPPHRFATFLLPNGGMAPLVTVLVNYFQARTATLPHTGCNDLSLTWILRGPVAATELLLWNYIGSRDRGRL